MEEWIKKSDVLELLSLPSDLMAEYIHELKGVWVDEEWSEDNWIFVEKEKPKDFVPVLGRIVSDIEDNYNVRECYLIDGQHFYFPTFNRIYQVDKWMPMPK